MRKTNCLGLCQHDPYISKQTIQRMNEIMQFQLFFQCLFLIKQHFKPVQYKIKEIFFQTKNLLKSLSGFMPTQPT